MRKSNYGLTLVELMISIAILAVIATLAAPSFTRMTASQRIKGMSEEIMSDLYQVKSDTVNKNAAITITFSATGYTVSAGGTTIKSFTIPNNNTVSPSSGDDYLSVQFEPVRSTATVVSGTSIDISNSLASDLKLRISVNQMGAPQICSPDGKITGYKSC